LTGKSYLKLSEARRLVNFRLKALTYPAMVKEWTGESELHKVLRRVSRDWFESKGYRVGRAKVGAYGCRYFSDYFVLSPEGEFQFVECLTNYANLSRKLQLLRYAPMWLVVPVNLGMPKNMLGLPERLHFLFIDPLIQLVVGTDQKVSQRDKR
jgi:hypothetical protein